MALSRVLRAVNWTDAAHVARIPAMLMEWAPITPLDAFEILSCGFPSKVVRLFAVRVLNSLSGMTVVFFLFPPDASNGWDGCLSLCECVCE